MGDFLKSKLSNWGSKKPLRMDFLKIVLVSGIFNGKLKVDETCL